jgi:hypothetical protein
MTGCSELRGRTTGRGSTAVGRCGPLGGACCHQPTVAAGSFLAAPVNLPKRTRRNAPVRCARHRAAWIATAELDADGYAAFVWRTGPAQWPKASGYARRMRVRVLLCVRTKKSSGLVFTHATKACSSGCCSKASTVAPAKGHRLVVATGLFLAARRVPSTSRRERSLGGQQDLDPQRWGIWSQAAHGPTLLP